MQIGSYSSSIPKILEEEGRQKVAKQLKTILEKTLKDTKNLRCLDVGCSSGRVTFELSGLFKETIGVDSDKDAIVAAQEGFKRNNTKFFLMNAEELMFKDKSFDVVVLNQVYEFTANPEKLVSEIFRVLKKGGICLVGARNKLAFFEGQTGIPLIHFLSQVFVTKLLSFFNIHYYPAKYFDYWQIRRLFEKFEITDKTIKILKNPHEYGFRKLVRYRPFFDRIPKAILERVIFLSPNFILICKKVN